jgi:nitroreductase
MNTLTAINSRRNVRDYTSDPISQEDLNTVLEAARRAPSAQNAQWWDLVVVTDPRRLGQLSKAWQGAGHVARSQATIAVIASPGADERQRGLIQYDLGQMTMQLMIAATDLGIGTAHAYVQDQELAREVLGFPEDKVCAWLIAMGYPKRPLRPIKKPKRRDLDDVVHRGHW